MFTLIQLNRATKITALLAMFSVLQGCAVATVVAITAGASMATDRRSIGNQIDDQNIELEAYNEITKNKLLNDSTNLQVVSVNGSVLVVGQAPKTYLKDQAIKIINNINGVVRIHNQIRPSLGPNLPSLFRHTTIMPKKIFALI